MKKILNNFLFSRKKLITLSHKLASGRSGALVVSSKLFVCPQCGNQSLSVIRKTYEQTIIVFCSNCHLNSSFEPSMEAYYDIDKAWEEFTAKFKKTQNTAEVAIT